MNILVADDYISHTKTLQEQLLLIMTQNSFSQPKVQNYSADCSEA